MGAEEEVLSLQPPKKPGCWQEVEEDAVPVAEVRVADGIGREACSVVVVVVMVVVLGSLHPNHPGVLQVVFVMVEVFNDDELVVEMVVVGSRQPHHPGVLHVVVRVLVEVEVIEEEVVGADPLLSKYFQLKQSIHSSSGTQGGG